jgi:hypothetical protein
MIAISSLSVSAFIFSMMVVSQSFAAEINVARAKFNYQMLCQGCHTSDGTGIKDVPQIKGFIGNFLTTSQGRDYLVQVPGSANSALNDIELAEVLNWIILDMGGSSVPENMKHYTAKEVAELRTKSLFEVVEYRKMIVSKLPIDKK